MGGKKQGSARTPHEAPDSLKSAQRLRAIGLISLGPIKGPVNKWKSTYFDNTPIQNENGVDDNDEASFNFKNTEVAFTLGTQDQAPLQGFEMSEREVSVSTEVKHTTPITRTVTDPDVTRLRVTLGVNALYEQNDQGDTNGTSVWFRILINGLPRATYEIQGKSSSRFYRSYIVDNLPERPFTITVERTTTDSTSQRLQNATNWVSYTEIIDTKLSYPNMALVGIKTDSRYNPNFPNVNFLLYGRLVKVPSSYDPETRTYSTALWKGDWKQAWTNNPAWVFYDLVTDPLAGLGQRVGDYGLDKFQLYLIAQYCDELVDDGYGGKEPRMTANLWLTDQRSAYEVLSDMASVFRAIAVWNGTQFTAIQDRTADPVCTYSQANVIDGKFSRQYAAMKSIYTAAEVEYADERNMYQKAVEYVADDLMIARYGYNVKKMTAYATTSRGQAHRWGKWVLATSLLEQCTITFSVGRQGLLHLPGDIIEIADNDYAGKTLGGRVVAVNGKVVTLDQPIEISGKSYLSYLSDEMKVVKIAISSIDSKNKAVVTLATIPTGLEPMDGWVLKTPVISTQLYRAIGITENDDGSYTITALQHEPQKEAIVDGSASFIPVTTTAHTGSTQKVANAEASINENGVKLTWEMPSSNSIVKYEVRLYRNGVLYQTYLDLETTELIFDDLPDGSYVAEIRSKNINGQLSDPVTRTFEINLRIPQLITQSLLFAIELDWELPKTATVGNYTELWRATENDVSKAIKIATVPYPQNTFTINGVSLSESYYFFARCGDKAGNKGEFTEGVFGEADHNPDTLLNALEGKITQSHLGKSLIDSLQADIDAAVGEEATQRKGAVANALAQILAETQARTAAIAVEANNRTKAIQAESANLTKKIQDEAKARGTAVIQLQQTDAQQAQLITAVTAKADQAIAGLQDEKTARAEADKAEAQERNVLTSRVASAEGGIAEVRQSIATANSSIAEVSQNLNAKIDGLQVGGRNYLLSSNSTVQNSNYLMTSYQISEPPKHDDDVVVTIYGELGGDRTAFGLFNTDSFHQVGNAVLVSDGIYRFSGKWLSENRYGVVNSSVLRIYQFLNSGSSQSRIDKIKLELGTIATDWTPAPEDVESAINAVSSKVDSVQQTLTTENQALGTRIDTVTASINDTKAQVSQVSNAVAGIDGRLSATSTLKTQVIAGGRKAIAGIALGAESDGKTAESSVIVMADKFGIVANANDGNVKPVFSVANGQVGIRGDLVVAGSVTNDKLSSGSGENLLTNPIFANPTNGVPYGWSLEGNATTKNCECFQDQDWGLKKNGYLPNENILKYSSANDAGATTYFSVVQLVPVTANKWYMASAYIGNHRSSKVELIIQYIRSDNTAISATHLIAGSGYAFAGINNAERAKIKFKAPSDCVAINFYLRKTATSLGNTNSYMFVARPMLEECTEHATEPSPWANSGVTAVHGGSIIANTIRGEHIQANQEIRAPNIQGGNLNIGNGNFLVDSNGNMTANSGIFRGSLDGATGTFRGDISAANGTFHGNIYARNLIDDVCAFHSAGLVRDKQYTFRIPPHTKRRILYLPSTEVIWSSKINNVSVDTATFFFYINNAEFKRISKSFHSQNGDMLIQCVSYLPINTEVEVRVYCLTSGDISYTPDFLILN